MLDISRERRPGRRPGRNSILLGSFDHLEQRQLLNGAVGVQSQFVAAGETHNVMIRSIDQDPDNDGRIPSTQVTFRGRIAGPRAADFTDTHAGLLVQVLEGATVIGSTPTFTLVPGQTGRVDFTVNATLLSGSPTPQALTFSISRDGFGSVPFVRGDNGQPLTATLITDTVGPTVVDVVDVASPRDTPVNDVNVIFSEPIDVNSFGFADLTLTRTVGGVATAVPLDNRVSISTVSTSPTPTYLITGLTDFTGAPGTYELTVDATGINDVLGNPGSGSLSTTFVFDPTLNLPPAPPAPALQSDNDTGFNGSDRITRAASPVFVVGGVPGDALVQLLRDGSVPVGTRTGPGPISDPSAPEGRHLYTVRQLFPMGVIGRESSPLPILIDRTSPTSNAGIDPTQLTFSGDFSPATSDRRPRIILNLGDTPDIPGNVLFAALTAIDGAALAPPVTANPALPGEQRVLTTPNDLQPGLHTLTIRVEDAAGNSSTQNVQVLVLASPSQGTPGTPVFTTLFDLKTLESVLPFGGPERPWSMAFDRTTQTLWAVIQGLDISETNQGGNRLLQVDPATGNFKFYNFQEFDPNSGPHGVAFDFESHLTPRVWFTQRSNHLLSYLDLTTNEVVSYDLGHLIRDHGFPNAAGDIHAVAIDRRGDVWVSDESDGLLLQLDFDGGEAGLASRLGTMVIHKIPPQAEIPGFVSLMGESVAGPHGVEVVIDDDTGEAFVYFTTLGDGRFNLLRTGAPGTGNIDQWTSWDLGLPKGKNGFVGAPLFPTVDTNETPGNPFDDVIYFGDPGFPTSGFPGMDVIRELQPGNYLRNPTATTSPIRTWHITNLDPSQPKAAPNQTFVDREGHLFFIDRSSGVGRLDTSVTQLTSGFQTADAWRDAAVVASSDRSSEPIHIHPSRIINADLLQPMTLQPGATLGGDPNDFSGRAGLDQYRVGGSASGVSGQGVGPFRGTITAGSIVYGSLVTNDLISSTVFAETARRKMSVVVGPGDSRKAFQVLRNGHLVVTSRGQGEVVDRQDDLTRSAADPLFKGDVAAVIDGFGIVHAIGRDVRGGLSEYRFDPSTGVWTSRRIGQGPAELTANPQAFVDPIRGVGALATDTRGHLMLFYPDAGQVIDLTATAGALSSGLVYSTVDVVSLGGSLFAYGTNQKGDLIEYAFSPGGASASVRRVPTPPGVRDTMVFQDVSAIVVGNVRHVFAADGASRLVHIEIRPDGSATAENVTELTKSSARGYSAYQQEFAGRVYSGVTPVLAPDGTLFVYGTNGRDLVEFQRSPSGSWQTTNLTNAPANRVFGNPTAYTLPNGDRHILLINEDGEVVEYYKLTGLDFATYNITLALGNNTGSPNPGFPNTLPGAPKNSAQGSTDDHANQPGFGATPLVFDPSGSVANASGVIGAAGDRDVFKFVATRRGRVVIEVTGRNRKLDTVLRVLNGRARTIAMNDNAGRRNHSRVVVNVVAGQTYYVEVRGKGKTLGNYDLSLRTIARLQRRRPAAQAAQSQKQVKDLGLPGKPAAKPTPARWAAHWSRGRTNALKAWDPDANG